MICAISFGIDLEFYLFLHNLKLKTMLKKHIFKEIITEIMNQ